ncbi:helix-turn-helix transcriptional regulator [Deinococcus xianganensis]|uniref:Helix-turn-helix domain-containing protein n=1 Tax=Deinococcus xianganensis TaxID=1507289 RepID=A0A6I4YW35_9DEIO|nr:helix-turn-helix transcriptional regulator [Deinococcus xianganensis]MXV21313.1 helix-turn-helix domain-containing protein [Deinococcus xianganensis]
MADQKKKSLSEWRELKGMTVQAMADAVGITRGRMGDYLQGRTEPSVTRAQQFAELLGITVDQVAWVPKPKTSRAVPPKKGQGEQRIQGGAAPQEDAEGSS